MQMRISRPQLSGVAFALALVVASCGSSDGTSSVPVLSASAPPTPAGAAESLVRPSQPVEDLAVLPGPTAVDQPAQSDQSDSAEEDIRTYLENTLEIWAEGGVSFPSGEIKARGVDTCLRKGPALLNSARLFADPYPDYRTINFAATPYSTCEVLDEDGARQIYFAVDADLDPGSIGELSPPGGIDPYPPLQNSAYDIGLRADESELHFKAVHDEVEYYLSVRRSEYNLYATELATIFELAKNVIGSEESEVRNPMIKDCTVLEGLTIGGDVLGAGSTRLFQNELTCIHDLADGSVSIGLNSNGDTFIESVVNASNDSPDAAFETKDLWHFHNGAYVREGPHRSAGYFHEFYGLDRVRSAFHLQLLSPEGTYTSADLEDLAVQVHAVHWGDSHNLVLDGDPPRDA